MNLKVEGFHVFSGPNQYADFASVVLLFDREAIFPNNSKLTLEHVTELQVLFSNYKHFASINHLVDKSAEEVICELAKLIQTGTNKLNIRSKLGQVSPSISYIALSYFSIQGSLLALTLGFNLLRYILNKDIGSQKIFSDRIQVILKRQESLQPDQTSSVMMNMALELNIPMYQYIDNNKFLCYGQGKNSVVFQSASSEFDSGIGVMLQQDKHYTASLINGMGYPGTEQRVVDSVEAAIQAAKELGYPVAVKPIGQGQGYGVSANIINQQELQQAYQEARRYRSYAVIVEKHVEGDAYRITIANGKLIGAICRKQAMVIGDGAHSIFELIKQENINRAKKLKKEEFISEVIIDESLKKTISKLNYHLESIPKENEKVVLRSIANLSTGGTFYDVTDDVHEDTVRMAIEVSKYFRLDVVGLDFLTTDIKKSWKDEGAIIEINTTPALRQEVFAKNNLLVHFSNKNMGRIPTILFVDISEKKQEEIINSITKTINKLGLAYVSESTLKLNGDNRNPKGKTLNEKCLAMLTDPGSEEIFVSASNKELLALGLPMDYFDKCFINKNENNLDSWFIKFCGEVFRV